MGAHPNDWDFFTDMIARAPALAPEVAMVWAYFDETVVHEKVEGQNGVQFLPRDLIIGGCVSTLEKWKAFETKWLQVLKDENVTTFHAKDFYAFRREFEWYTTDREKDWPRHAAFRDRLADLIIEHVEEALAFTAAVSVGATEKAVYKRAYVDGAFRALHELSREVLRPSGGAHVILARHPSMPPWLLLRYFAQFNWDNSLKGCGIFDPREVIPLQAADFVCHAVNRTWNGLEAKSASRLGEGFGKRGKQFRVQLGSSWNPPSEIFDEEPPA